MTIIQGEPTYIIENLNQVLNGVGAYLGKRYHNVVFDTVEKIYFYEQQENETRREAIEEISGRLVDDEEFGTEIGQENAPCFYFMNVISPERKDQVVIYQKAPYEIFQKSLSHEMAHAICGHIDPFIIEDKELYLRNGLWLVNDYSEKYSTASEGFMEMISYGILEKMGLSLTVDMINLPYLIAYGNAKFIYDEIGHQKVMDCLILNQGDLIQEFNQGMRQDYFGRFEKLAKVNLLERGENVNNRWKEVEPVQVEYIKKKYYKK